MVDGSVGDEFSTGDAIILAVLTVAGVAGFHLSPVDAAALVGLEFEAIFSISILFLAGMALPIAWIATMSFDGMRKESLASFIVLPGIFRGGLFGLVCVGLPVAVVFASYVARSTYNGRNPFWTCFKAGASIVTVFAILLATVGAYTIMYEEGIRQDVRDGVLDRVTDRAVDVANETLNGANGTSAVEQQQDVFVSQASRLSQNVSETTILASQRTITRQMDRYEGTRYEFSSEQRTVIDQTFTALQAQLPGNISGQVADRVEERFDSGTGLQPSDEQVRGRVDAGLDTVFGDTTTLAGMTFVVLLSLVYSLKIPFELFSGTLGYLLHRVAS